MTWVDIIFIGIFVYFAFRGWTQGIIYLSASFIAFIVSLFLALRYSGVASNILQTTLGIENKWAAFIAFFFVAFIVEAILSDIFSRIIHKAPLQMVQGRASQIIGACMCSLTGIFLVNLFLFVLLLVPFRGTIKDDIRTSFFIPKIFSFVELYTGPLPDMLRQSAKELTKFITVKPNSRESIALDISIREEDMKFDYESEDRMVALVNTERRKFETHELRLDQSMVDVARKYAKRMLKEGFFSHYDSNGFDVSDRLAEGGVKFFFAGENLAYAPDLSSAHEGLMNSEGHKKNILDDKFQRVGIGVIDAGVWGKMFVQVFTD